MVNKTVIVREYGYGENVVGSPPHNLKLAIQVLQEALLEIPTEHRETAEVSFEPEYEFGEYYDHIRVSYERPEAPWEEASRKSEERATTLKWIEEQEALIRRRKAELES